MTKQKGGDFVSMLFASGLGAYAAKQSSSMRSLGWTLLKYAAVFIAVSVVVYIVLIALGISITETFTPMKPSAEGDNKAETGAGNTLLY